MRAPKTDREKLEKERSKKQTSSRKSMWVFLFLAADFQYVCCAMDFNKKFRQTTQWWGAEIGS